MKPSHTLLIKIIAAALVGLLSGCASLSHNWQVSNTNEVQNSEFPGGVSGGR